MWEISIGWQLSDAFPTFGEVTADHGRQALEDRALRRGMVHTLTRADASRLLRWHGGSGLRLALGDASEADQRAGAVLLEKAGQAGVDAAVARVHRLRLHAVVAGSLDMLLQSWPPCATQLVSNTWWKPWLRPKTWAPTRQAQEQARKEERRRQKGLQPAQLPAAPQAAPGQAPDQAALQMQIEAQAAAQSTAQAEADMRDRLQKQNQAKDWYQRQWLQSHVRSALFYALRTSDTQERMPIMRATLTPQEELGPRPRDSPQGRFPAGLPDAVQEIFPQLSPELASISEGSKAPPSAGKDGSSKKRVPLTAQVIRIRGAPTTASTFAPVLGIRSFAAPASLSEGKLAMVSSTNGNLGDDGHGE